MKKIIAAAFVVFALSSSAQNIINSNEVVVEITGATTRADLKSISDAMRTTGLLFRYNPKFDGQTHLIGISYTILDTNGNELGRAENNNLATAGAKSKFRFRKQNERLEAVCIGTCD
jgi:hypothetical protein